MEETGRYIARVEMRKDNMADWLASARPMLKQTGKRVRVYTRTVRAGSAWTTVYVAVVLVEPDADAQPPPPRRVASPCCAGAEPPEGE